MGVCSHVASVLVIAAACVALAAQEPGTFDGRPVRILSNDKLSLAVRTVGGAMVQLVMKDQADAPNPFEGLGHFVCVDGRGDVLMPCGRCRQLLWENGGPELRVWTVSGVARMTDVLPDAFGPDNLRTDLDA